MAVRKDEVQISITFITDESKKYAKLLNDTKKFEASLFEARNSISKLNRELKGGNVTEQRRSEILDEIARKQKIVDDNMKSIARSGRTIEGLDLKGLAPSQLVQRAKQLSRAMRLIPQSAPDYEKLEKELKEVNDELATMRKRTRGVATGMEDTAQKGGFMARMFKSIGPALGVATIIGGIAAIGRALFRVGKESLQLFNLQAKADAQLKATLRSTANVAGRSFEQLKQQAAELQKVTLFGDEQTQQAQALLLTFTNVRTEVFDKTIPLIQDYATALATASGEEVNLKDASIQVGKALNDPIRGVTALSRAGVQFTDQQRKQIRVLQESGDIVGAQTIVLQELEKQFAGSARAAAEAGLGAYTQLGNRVGDLKESFGQLIERGLRRLIPVADKVVGFVEKLVASVLSGKAATGQFANGVNGLIFVFKALTLPVRALSHVLAFFLFDVLRPIHNFIQTNIVPILRLAAARFLGIIKVAKGLPLIGSYIRGIVNFLKLFVDAVENTSATFSGLRAAAEQSVRNTLQFFAGLATGALILAKKMDRAFSIKPATKARLSKEIKDLESLKKQAAESGQSIGQAYANARDEAIATAAKEREAEEVVDTFNGNLLREAAAKTTKAIFEARQQEAELAFVREELALDRQFARQEISEQQHTERLLAARRERHARQLELTKEFYGTESIEAAQVQKELLNTEKEYLSEKASLTRQAATSVDTVEEARIRENFLREQLEQQIITEQQYEEQLVQIRTTASNQRLEQLEREGLERTALTEKESTQTAAIQEQVLREQLANEVITVEQFEEQLVQVRTTAAQRRLELAREQGSEEVEVSKEAFSAMQQEAELAFAREELALDAQLLHKEISEREHTERLLSAQQERYTRQLKLARAFYGEESREAIEAQQKLLGLEATIATNRESTVKERQQKELAAVDTVRSVRENELRERFARQVIDEQQYEEQLLQIKLNAATRRLEVLRANGLENTEVFRRAEQEKLDVQVEVNQLRVDNEKRTKELRQQLERQALDVTQDALQAGIELLSRDEAARKKNAAAIKAFQSGKVIIDGIKEVQGIFAGYSSLGPIGQAIAIVQAAVATARTAAAVNKIRAQKFAGGGQVGAIGIPTLTGMLIQSTPNIPTQPNGDNIFATVKKGEVILNAAQQAALGGAPTFQRIGVPGFASGGATSIPNTTPTARESFADGNNAAVERQAVEIKGLREDVRAMTMEMSNWQRELQVKLNYLDVEEAGAKLVDVRGEAGL